MNQVDIYFASNYEEKFLKNCFSPIFTLSYIEKLKASRSSYSILIYKPFPRFAQRFGIAPEILCIYSPYPDLQARTLIQARELQTNTFRDRVHPVWNVLVSASETIESELNIMNQGIELAAYSIPFSRKELEIFPDIKYLSDRFEKYVRGRDLFAFNAALQTDTFFFGRSAIVDELVGQVENGQSFGLFGLRKTGKTSVLLAVERKLELHNQTQIVHLDCQEPAVFSLRWNILLNKIYNKVDEQNADKFIKEENISDKFRNYIIKSNKKVFIALDEIENITFELPPNKKWNEEFHYFWGTMRALQQTSGGKFSFGIVGVNPYILDKTSVNGRDNPIFLGATPHYIDRLDDKSVTIMVKEIGRCMGISFEESIYTWLNDQFGGNPLLIRQICSLVYKQTNFQEDQPRYLSLSNFMDYLPQIDGKIHPYLQNMLTVLAQYYPKEYDNLMFIAETEKELVKMMKDEDEYKKELEHLYSYQILKDDDNGIPYITVKSLEKYLKVYGVKLKESMIILENSSSVNMYDLLPPPTDLDLWNRLNITRNVFEPLLRKLVFQSLMLKFGEKRALQEVYDVFGAEKQKVLYGYKLSEIFRGESRNLYFKDLIRIILKHWDSFFHALGNDRRKFETHMEMINNQGRSDAHATPILESDVVGIENIINHYIELISEYISM